MQWWEMVRRRAHAATHILIEFLVSRTFGASPRYYISKYLLPGAGATLQRGAASKACKIHGPSPFIHGESKPLPGNRIIETARLANAEFPVESACSRRFASRLTL